MLSKISKCVTGYYEDFERSGDEIACSCTKEECEEPHTLELLLCRRVYNIEKAIRDINAQLTTNQFTEMSSEGRELDSLITKAFIILKKFPLTDFFRTEYVKCVDPSFYNDYKFEHRRD